MEISHLFFTNGLQLFAATREDQADCIRQGLAAFCNASGQRINFGKSLMFISSNVAEQEVKALCIRIGVPRTTELGC